MKRPTNIHQLCAPLTSAVRVLLVILLLQAPSLAQGISTAMPEEMLMAYLCAVYARDYAMAYTLLSEADRQLKTAQEYSREHDAFSNGALELTRVLAALIRFENLHTEIVGDHATVTVTTVYPHIYAPVVHELLLKLDQKRLDALNPAERAQRADQLRELATSGGLPMIREKERWELVREDGQWRIFLNWAAAVEIHFEAATRAGLPWEFVPLQPIVRAKSGDSLQTLYRVKNLADRAITARAWHKITPPEGPGSVEIVACFCFRQLTLAPGEERQLPVTFRVDDEIPEAIQHIRVRYTFDPLASPSGRTRK